MGKGGYLGGGTIVGPTSRWSDHADFPIPEQPLLDKDEAGQKASRGRTTRNERRRRAHQRYETAVNTPAVQRQAARPLDPAAQRRIDTHRLLIAEAENRIVQARRDRENEVTQLRDLLRLHGLPTIELDTKDGM